jgi:cell wall-associated NlpC family hydrolase
MSTIQKAIDFAVSIAKDDSHGYDQGKRDGKPDYDCSSLMIASWESAGVKIKEAGATYTGNMRLAFLKRGFEDVFSKVNVKTGTGLMPGDVLLHEGKHTAMYIGNGQLVHAAINENGKIVGGKPGDQTGKEIWVRSYYNHPWNSVLRYVEPKTAQEIAVDYAFGKILTDKAKWLKRAMTDAEIYALLSNFKKHDEGRK